MSAQGRPAVVRIRDVGPRDGLQVEAPVSVEARVALVEALVAAGVQEVEAAAFVSPSAVPAMAGAAEVMATISRRPDVRYGALVPNLRGAQLALEAGADALSVTVSASPEYNRRNVRMSIDESVAQVTSIAAAVGGVPVDVVVSCAFGSPYEGDISPEAVGGLGDQVLGAGATSLTYADTTGMATPRRIDELLDEVGVDVGLHLHETRGTALVNAYAALERGVARFDTSVGGLGGSPFAAGSAGNLATEDLVHLLDDLGVTTGVNLGRLLEASALAARTVGHDVPSRVAAAGPRSRLIDAR
ncbi:MAG TPA: hydroxymethylglutaryl-CoA lyase [Acidimicrobiales bacterium]|jgi:hydroxymethylglutaryl-CoA lyase|nr:hydroxymethylglutaryl-CoA lyase [Acidimicrobiales bacterium]